VTTGYIHYADSPDLNHGLLLDGYLQRPSEGRSFFTSRLIVADRRRLDGLAVYRSTDATIGFSTKQFACRSRPPAERSFGGASRDVIVSNHRAFLFYSYSRAGSMKQLAWPSRNTARSCRLSKLEEEDGKLKQTGIIRPFSCLHPEPISKASDWLLSDDLVLTLRSSRSMYPVDDRRTIC